uniref:Uncharacterized protein n=1 Tax=Anopheles arabiensis TaxID=7173 RepID=A0A182IH92_ANOAR
MPCSTTPQQSVFRCRLNTKTQHRHMDMQHVSPTQHACSRTKSIETRRKQRNPKSLAHTPIQSENGEKQYTKRNPAKRNRTQS